MTAAPTLQITGVDFVAIPTSDHARACAFYGGTLGLPKLTQWGEMPATEFQAGNLTLVAFDPTGFGQGEATPNAAPIALQVDDVAAAKDALTAAGVEFAPDVMDSGVCHMAFFFDPDGNPLILHHRYAPRGVEPGAED